MRTKYLIVLYATLTLLILLGLRPIFQNVTTVLDTAATGITFLASPIITLFSVIGDGFYEGWLRMQPYLFVIRCRFFSDVPGLHCKALRHLYPTDFIRQCSATGLVWDQCIELATHFPFAVMEYCRVNGLGNAFDILRLF